MHIKNAKKNESEGVFVNKKTKIVTRVHTDRNVVQSRFGLTPEVRNDFTHLLEKFSDSSNTNVFTFLTENLPNYQELNNWVFSHDITDDKIQERQIFLVKALFNPSLSNIKVETKFPIRIKSMYLVKLPDGHYDFSLENDKEKYEWHFTLGEIKNAEDELNMPNVLQHFWYDERDKNDKL